MAGKAAGSPARIATLVAVPVAAIVGVLVFRSLGGLPGAEKPEPPATGPVTVAAPTLDEGTATVCRALMARLPETAGGLGRRPVTGPEQNTAYGDPPITLSCGVPRPAVPQDAQLLDIGGVCWWYEERSTEVRWTTVDRRVPVRATVPRPVAGSWLVHLSPDMLATVPVDQSAQR